MQLRKTGIIFPQSHDPDDQCDYMFRFRLSGTESIQNATVQVIDPDTNNPPVVPTDLIIADVSFGLNEDGLTWGVTFWVSGGTHSKSYYIRCQITTDSSPLPRIISRVARLL